MSKIEYDKDGKIKRRFTPDWKESGEINIDSLLPKLVTVVIAQIDVMVTYIQELHDEIDRLNKKIENQE
ncbi:hypothetical protein LX73_2308 [Fodinibius salinus]|uniref:Uncharacterized protein n=1 Tax=Fodinibius salinus TaxID=860790 RepID=A0A5D3YK06_9BACT|nr:hypothetical protein [Fodinibius salinus]TYP92062.1 hypothetical protein LX73_2308 [Fodinibius salinus]